MTKTTVAYLIKSKAQQKICLDRNRAVDVAIDLLGGRDSLIARDKKAIGTFLESGPSDASFVGTTLNLSFDVSVTCIELV